MAGWGEGDNNSQSRVNRIGYGRDTGRRIEEAVEGRSRREMRCEDVKGKHREKRCCIFK